MKKQSKSSLLRWFFRNYIHEKRVDVAKGLGRCVAGDESIEYLRGIAHQLQVVESWVEGENFDSFVQEVIPLWREVRSKKGSSQFDKGCYEVMQEVDELLQEH